MRRTASCRALLPPRPPPSLAAARSPFAPRARPGVLPHAWPAYQPRSRGGHHDSAGKSGRAYLRGRAHCSSGGANQFLRTGDAGRSPQDSRAGRGSWAPWARRSERLFATPAASASPRQRHLEQHLPSYGATGTGAAASNTAAIVAYWARECGAPHEKDMAYEFREHSPVAVGERNRAKKALFCEASTNSL